MPQHLRAAAQTRSIVIILSRISAKSIGAADATDLLKQAARQIANFLKPNMLKGYTIEVVISGESSCFRQGYSGRLARYADIKERSFSLGVKKKYGGRVYIKPADSLADQIFCLRLKIWLTLTMRFQRQADQVATLKTQAACLQDFALKVGRWSARNISHCRRKDVHALPMLNGDDIGHASADCHRGEYGIPLTPRLRETCSPISCCATPEMDRAIGAVTQTVVKVDNT